MGLLKPEPSSYFDRRKGILDDWDSLTEAEQQKFTVDNKRWLDMQERRRKVGKLRKGATKSRANRDPETTAKNKAAKAAADLANKRNREMNARCLASASSGLTKTATRSPRPLKGSSYTRRSLRGYE